MQIRDESHLRQVSAWTLGVLSALSILFSLADFGNPPAMLILVLGLFGIGTAFAVQKGKDVVAWIFLSALVIHIPLTFSLTPDNCDLVGCDNVWAALYAMCGATICGGLAVSPAAFAMSNPPLPDTLVDFEPRA